MQMDQVWVYKHHYLLYRNDFSLAQLRKTQLLLGSTAPVLGLVPVLASVDSVRTLFDSVQQVRFGHLTSIRKVWYR